MSIQATFPESTRLPAAEVHSPPPAPTPCTVIRPPNGWQLINVRELWHFRDLIFILAWRDVKVRYKQTALGAAWAILQPAMMMVVFTIVFSRMGRMSSGHDPSYYPLFVLAGLLPWTFFNTALTSAGNSVVGSERLITKIYFPRLAIPFASVGAALVDFVVSCALLAVMMIVYRVPPTVQVLLAPIIFALIILAALGLGSLLAALNVAYRDFRYAVPFLLQIAMFATPTIYTQPTGESGLGMRVLLVANPMAGLIAAFRACVLGGEIPWGSVGIAASLALCLFAAGCLYFRRVEDGFADVI